MGCLLLASIADEAAPIAVGFTAIGSAITFAGLFVRGVLAAQKQTADQSHGWQDMMAAALRRAEAAEKATDDLRQRADVAERRAESAEQVATLAQGRSDLLDFQCDELRRQVSQVRAELEDLRKGML